MRCVTHRSVITTEFVLHLMEYEYLVTFLWETHLDINPRGMTSIKLIDNHTGWEWLRETRRYISRGSPGILLFGREPKQLLWYG